MAVAAIKAGAKVVDAVGGKGTSLKIALYGAGVIALVVVFMFMMVATTLTSIMAAVSGAASTVAAGCNGGSATPSPLALKDIPAAALDAYQKAGAATGVNWTYIAAIGKVESGHGSANGSTLGVDGQVTPAILGPVLNGSGVGGNITAIMDTDNGVYDGNTTYDRAMGPMQFMPGTWRGIGQDGNFDGKKDPQNILDAALATGMYLKQSGAPADMVKAILAYNHSMSYVALVQGFAAGYDAVSGPAVVNASAKTVPAPVASSSWTLPLTQGGYVLSTGFASSTAPHQGQDFTPTSGAPILAMGAGTVLEAGPAPWYGNWVKIGHGGNIQTVYGQVFGVLVKKGQVVTAGQPIARAGSGTGPLAPLLHLEVIQAGAKVDPVAFLAPFGVNLANVEAGCGFPVDSLPPGASGKILSFALSKVGLPYVWGGTGPIGYDCSGLTQGAYTAGGMSIPRTSEQQWAWSQAVTVPNGQEQAGDLIFFHGPAPSHVGIVLDPATKMMVHAPKTGDVVKVVSYNTPYWVDGLVGFKRMPGGGTATAVKGA